jgi:endonuclease-3
MKSSLEYSSAWQLLVATMLSAQAQDRQVNIVTKPLFKIYPNVSDYTGLRPSELYKYTKSIGLYKNKSKNIISAANKIMKDFKGRVPSSVIKLQSLPGVGRKTANVVQYNWFGKSEGIAIDTHCITVSNRLGIAKGNNPKIIEEELMKITDKRDWGNITHLFIALGRDVCTARAKHCEMCVLKNLCPSSTVKK